MSKGIAAIYVFWSLSLIGVGAYIFNKMTDTANPNSLKSNLEKIEETIDENY